MSTFTFLYHLENFYLRIIEVNRLDIAENATVSEKYMWLRIDKETSKISPLTFRSMDSASEVQERYFEEGYLKFNGTIGTYIEKFNSAQHPLENNSTEKLDAETQATIERYLEGLRALA